MIGCSLKSDNQIIPVKTHSTENQVISKQLWFIDPQYYLHYENSTMSKRAFLPMQTQM